MSTRPAARAVDLALELGLYAYDGYHLEAARSSGYPLLTLDGTMRIEWSMSRYARSCLKPAMFVSDEAGGPDVPARTSGSSR